MAIAVADNFSYQGAKPLDARTKFGSVDAMAAYDEASLYDGCIAYVANTKTYYSFDSSNEEDATTGKWREFKGGGGGEGLVFSTYATWARWTELVSEVDVSGITFSTSTSYEANEPVENTVDVSGISFSSYTTYSSNAPVETEVDTSDISFASSVVIVTEE